tara:strand:- start:2678 stop:2944 length:267 start_codon:yes stop_codon:yes gene_type:complete
MLNQKILDEISSKVNDLVAQSPVKDVEQNMRVLLSGVFSKLDLVTRDEFDVQQEMLIRARTQLAELESKITDLEKQLKPNKKRSSKKT